MKIVVSLVNRDDVKIMSSVIGNIEIGDTVVVKIEEPMFTSSELTDEIVRMINNTVAGSGLLVPTKVCIKVMEDG